MSMEDAKAMEHQIRLARLILDEARTRGISESNEDAVLLAQLVLKWFGEE